MIRSLVLAAITWGPMLLAAGCARPPLTGPAGQHTATSVTDKPSGRDLADGNWAACREFVFRVNAYFSQHPTEAPCPLTDARRRLLREETDLSAAQIAELERPTLDLPDAYYLENCLLFRDAARSLIRPGASVRKQAEAACSWVARHVRLVEHQVTPCPPAWVLRRGWGTAVERAVVCLALWEQLGLEGCLLRAASQRDSFGLPRLWGVGVRDGSEVWLLDVATGRAVPGPAGAEAASLRLAHRGEVAPPAGLSAEDFRQSDVVIHHAALAYAPRVHAVQALLSADLTVRLAVDLEATLARWRQLVPSAEVWKHDPRRPPNLWEFLPPGAGGHDRSNRQAEAERALVPWNRVPAVVRQLPPGELSDRLRYVFAQPFLALSLETGQPRDLMLRGRLDEAVAALVRLREELQRQREQAARIPNLEETVAQWCAAAQAAYQERARLSAAPTPATATAAWETVQMRLAELARASQPVEVFLRAAVAEPLAARATYLLAVAKHEQALAAQHRHGPGDPAVRAAWQAALSWWTTYLEDYPDSPAAADARHWREQALQAVERFP